jgi:methyl-coenzyme M reductase gamma subunit
MSIHPPLEEMEEPECSVREMVEPTEGAKAGDRIRCVQFTDSMQFAPITPRQRALSAYNRYRGVDIGVSSGGTIIEARERDIEKIAKELIDSETFDTARTGLRGRTVDGHAVRLDANGMMFDALRRGARDERTGEVTYVKDMIGGAMDKKVKLGNPLTEDELRKRTTMYRNALGGVPQEVEDPESMDVIAWIHWMRTVGGFQPWKKIEEIKGGKKDIGILPLAELELKLTLTGFSALRGVISFYRIRLEGRLLRRRPPGHRDSEAGAGWWVRAPGLRPRRAARRPCRERRTGLPDGLVSNPTDPVRPPAPLRREDSSHGQ